MRSILQILLLTLLVFSTALASAALAREVVLHIPEDAPAGTTVAYLGELLELPPHEHVQLVDGHDGRFRIAENRRLIVGPRGLDHETAVEHHLDVRIVSGPPGDASTEDPLQDKFKELVDTQQEPGQAGTRRPSGGIRSSDEDTSSARSAAIRVLVDDVAEMPVLLGSRLGVPGSSSPLPGQRIGRAVVVDLDSNDQHRFELLEGAAWIRVDPVTGELFLRDDVNPLCVAALQVRVRVTDRAGLSAEASYPVRLNDRPPAPPLPALLADTNPRSLDPATQPADTIVPSAPTEVAEPDVADQQVALAASPAPIAAEPHAAAVPAAHHLPRIAVESPADRWVTRIRQFLSQAGAGPLGGHPHGWLITLAVVLCVAVIVVSGVRNAIQAGRVEMEAAPSAAPASAPSRSQPAGTPILRSPSEIADILARLDTVIGKVDIAAAEAGPAHSTDVQKAASEPLEHEFETAATLAQTPEGAELHPEGAEVVASVAPAVRYFPVQQPGAAEAGPLRGAGQQRPGAASGMSLDERERMEQFRRISRMMNRADIGRHNRVRLRYEWMSIGMTSLVCVVTGTVCVFTSCFGAMSVPLGSVMFSVAAVLLMRPDLYEDFSTPEDADWGHGGPL